MSETAVEREGQGATPGRQRPGQGKKILGLPRGQALAFGGALLALGLYLLYRARKNAQAAQQQQSTSTCPDGSTPDANGNCPQNSQDWSGAIDTLQSEIADLQGAMAGAGGAGGAGSAGSVGAATGTTTAPPTTAPVTAPSSPATQAKPSAAAAGPIANLRVTSTGTTSFTVAWNKATGDTGGYSYIVRDLATHTQVGQPHHTTGLSATVTGLKSKTDYNFGIQALPAGPGDNIHVRTK